MSSKKIVKELIKLFGNEKTKLAFWVLDNLNSENQLITTQRKIAEKTGISIRTINSTMKALVDNNILIKINSGAYKLNLESKDNKKDL